MFVLIAISVLRMIFCFFFQAEDGIRDLVRSRGLGDVYKRQVLFDVFGEYNETGLEGAGNWRLEPDCINRLRFSGMILSLIHISEPTRPY